MNISFVYWIWSHDHPFQRWNKWPVNNAFMLLHVYLYEHPNWCLFCPGFEPGTRKFKSKETSVLPMCHRYSIQSCRQLEPVTSYLTGWDSKHWAMGMATEYYQEISPNFWVSALTTEPLGRRELVMTICVHFGQEFWSHDHPFQRWNKWPVNNAFMLLHVYLYEHPNWCLFCPGFEPGTRKFKSKETSVLPMCQGYSIQSCRRFEPVTSYLTGWDSEHWAMGMAASW